MTLPDERYRALVQTQQLLLDLLDSRKTPRVPKEIRQRAKGCLRHYPTAWDLEQIAESVPNVIAKELKEFQWPKLPVLTDTERGSAGS